MTRPNEPGLNFIIVGASIAGLASAIALKAPGHNILILEKEKQLGGRLGEPGSFSSGCARVPPNGCKILFDWGLGSDVTKRAMVGQGFSMHKYNPGQAPDYIGLNRWDPELLSEARGEFLLFSHKDLLQILYDKATAEPSNSDDQSETQRHPPPKVTVHFGAEVVHVDLNVSSVTLTSGVVHIGDAVIGADGARGIVRETLMREEPVSDSVGIKCDRPTGLSVCSAIIPEAVGVQDPELAKLYSYPQSSLGTVFMGSNRGAQTCLAGQGNDLAFWVYTPDASQDGRWAHEAKHKMTEIIGPCGVLIQKLAARATSSACIQIMEHYELDSWVSESGKVVVLGEAAHPFPPAALHTYSIALEDGAFMGKIFSHTRSRDRVAEFLHAFEEHRRDRCSRIRQFEQQFIASITLPDGEMQVERDSLMRANQKAGRNVMDVPESDLQQMWSEARMVFDYEPVDDADEWWMSWGRLRDAAAASNVPH